MNSHRPAGRAGPRRPRSLAAFTLIEVMLALSIMSLMMVAFYGTLETTLNTRDVLSRDVKAARLGPQILETVENDLRRCWLLNIQDDAVFKGESHSLLGENADTLVFLTTVDSSLTQRVDEREVSSDLCETGYRLRPNPAVPDVMELWRRQSFHIDDEPLDDGTYERLHDRVISFQLRYYEDDDVESEPLDEWDASKSHSLPSMVEIKLGIEVGPRDEGAPRSDADRASRTYWFERLVPLGRDAALCLRVHPRPPVFAEGTAGGVAGGEGEDGEGEEGEGDGEGDGEGGPDGQGGVDDPFGGAGSGGGGSGGGGSGGGDLGDILDEIFGGGGG